MWLKELVVRYKEWWGLDKIEKGTFEHAVFGIVSVAVLGVLLFVGIWCAIMVLRVMVRLL